MDNQGMQMLKRQIRTVPPKYRKLMEEITMSFEEDKLTQSEVKSFISVLRDITEAAYSASPFHNLGFLFQDVASEI